MNYIPIDNRFALNFNNLYRFVRLYLMESG